MSKETAMTQDERDGRDFAIEFGEYLAKAAEEYQRTVSDTYGRATIYDLGNCDALQDDYRSLSSAIYEFRKRAARAAQSGKPAAPDIITAIREFHKRDADAPPWPYDADLNGIWQDGVSYALLQVGKHLGIKNWDADGASESIDGDIAHEISSIFVTAKLYDPETDDWATLKSPTPNNAHQGGSEDVEIPELVEFIRKEGAIRTGAGADENAWCEKMQRVAAILKTVKSTPSTPAQEGEDALRDEISEIIANNVTTEEWFDQKTWHSRVTDCGLAAEEIMRHLRLYSSVTDEMIDAAMEAMEKSPSGNRRERFAAALTAALRRSRPSPAPDVKDDLFELAKSYGLGDTSEGLFLGELHSALLGLPGPSPADVVNDLFAEIAALRADLDAKPDVNALVEALRKIIDLDQSDRCDAEVVMDAVAIAQKATASRPQPVEAERK